MSAGGIAAGRPAITSYKQLLSVVVQSSIILHYHNCSIITTTAAAAAATTVNCCCQLWQYELGLKEDCKMHNMEHLKCGYAGEC